MAGSGLCLSGLVCIPILYLQKHNSTAANLTTQNTKDSQSPIGHNQSGHTEQDKSINHEEGLTNNKESDETNGSCV